MENFVNKEILEKVDEVIIKIKKSKKYRDYQFLKKKLENNDRVQALISDIKQLQKEIVKEESLQQDTMNLEGALNEKLELLNRIPLYVEFIETQGELNTMYQLLKQELDDYFYSVLN